MFLNGWLNNSLTQAVRRLVGRKRTASAVELILGTPLAGNLPSATPQEIPYRSSFREGGAHCPLNGAAGYLPHNPHPQQPHFLLDELWNSGYWRLEAVVCLDCHEENLQWCRELGHTVIYRHVLKEVQ